MVGVVVGDGWVVCGGLWWFFYFHCCMLLQVMLKAKVNNAKNVATTNTKCCNMLRQQLLNVSKCCGNKC